MNSDYAGLRVLDVSQEIRAVRLRVQRRFIALAYSFDCTAKPGRLRMQSIDRRPTRISENSPLDRRQRVGHNGRHPSHLTPAYGWP